MTLGRCPGHRHFRSSLLLRAFWNHILSGSGANIAPDTRKRWFKDIRVNSFGKQRRTGG